jgi:hypothetical protein
VSIVYPLSGNRASLIRKETARVAAKMEISFFAVKLIAFPLRLVENICVHGIRRFFKIAFLIFFMNGAN